MARFSPAARGIPFCRQWFCLRQQGWEDRANHCTEGLESMRSWSDCPVWVGRTSIFPQGSAEEWGLCLQAVCSSMLSYDCAFLLWEIIWDAQAVVSCQEIVVSGLHAIIFLSHPFPHWWQVSTFWALFQLLSEFFGVLTDFFGVFSPAKKDSTGSTGRRDVQSWCKHCPRDITTLPSQDGSRLGKNYRE